MDRNRIDVDRRSVLRGMGAGILPLGLGSARADPVSDVYDEAIGGVSSVFGEVGQRINEVRYPLVGVPSIREPGESLRVELDVDGGGTDVSASLVPSFGAARPRTDLELESVGTDESRIWNGETYLVAEFAVPELDRRFTEGLYDLQVTVDGKTDGQPRAVSVHEAFPAEPSVAILGDPHVGDPRPLQDGAQRSFQEGGPEPFLFRYGETIGTGTSDDRWGAFQRAVAEVNAADPDFVLVIGDLAFGSANYYGEYEDAYRILNGLNAPSFVTLGNHDGYVSPGVGVDGKELWRRYFAPWYYAVDVRPDLHFVSIDSYDWPALDRTTASSVPSTWGGQVRDEQFAWLEFDLRSWRADHDGTILTMSHHNPSWRQTERSEATRTVDDVPGAEQLARGVEMSGGGWVGENRIALRNLLADVGVSLHVSGHAHRDRLARYHGADTVVATTGSGLEHVGPDDELLATPTDEKRAILRDGDATLFVEATTAASGTTQYWGWRTVPLGRDGGAVDPTGFGYPASDVFLEDRTMEADRWTAENADLGLYSTSSYLLDASVVVAEDDRATVRIDNDLERPFDGAVTLPLRASDGVSVENGDQVWRRSDGKCQDVRVTFHVPSDESLSVTAKTTAHSSGSTGHGR